MEFLKTSKCPLLRIPLVGEKGRSKQRFYEVAHQKNENMKYLGKQNGIDIFQEDSIDLENKNGVFEMPNGDTKPFFISVDFNVMVKVPTIEERLKDAGAEEWLKDIRENTNRYF